MMGKIKLKVGEWYQTRDGEILYCVGIKPIKTDYDAVCCEKNGSVWLYTTDGCYGTRNTNHRSDVVEHLPDCTGFDWVAPKRPDAPEGWRWVEEDEIIEKGDVYWGRSRELRYGDTAGSYIGFACSKVCSDLPHIWGLVRKVKPKLQLREGAWYERNDGRVYGPCKVDPDQPNEHDYKWCVGPWRYRDDGTNNVDVNIHLAKEVEPPKPKYRAFANSKEFAPHRDKFVCVNNPNDKHPEYYRVNVFNDHSFWLHSDTGIPYRRGLLEYRFVEFDADGNPTYSTFGVK